VVAHGTTKPDNARKPRTMGYSGLRPTTFEKRKEYPARMKPRAFRNQDRSRDGNRLACMNAREPVVVIADRSSEAHRSS
jgi:hypothetical protein